MFKVGDKIKLKNLKHHKTYGIGTITEIRQNKIWATYEKIDSFQSFWVYDQFITLVENVSHMPEWF